MRTIVVRMGVCLGVWLIGCQTPNQFHGALPDAASPASVDEADGGGFDETAMTSDSGSGALSIDGSPDQVSSSDVTAPDTTAATDLGPDIASDAARAICGNGVVEPGETCDPPGSCPSACPAKGCTRFTLEGSAASCTARCVETTPQASCTPGDGCCPSGCNSNNDADCSIICGNGVKEGAETCDPLSSCPTACAPNGCQVRRLINAGSCAAECVNDFVQTACAPGDGCCPGTCNNNSDTDCPVKCGNNAVEAGETCDPVASCQTQQAACLSDKDNVRTSSGDPNQCTFKCITVARSCGAADGYCPSNCAPAADVDCKKATGQSCNSGGECLTNYCADGFCCNQACSGTCYSCAAADTTGANGSCLPVKANADPRNDCPAQATTTCGTDGVCDGAGSCRKYGPSTQCSDPSCSSAVATPAGHCSGAGTCTIPNGVSCDKYQCSSNTLMCRTNCSADTDCTASNYCEGSTCVPRCRAPSGGNVIPFAGFDSADTVSRQGVMGGWAYRDAAEWDFRKDGVGCSSSGSAHVEEDFRPQLYSKCFGVSANQHYYFGYMALGDVGMAQLATCTVAWYTASDCSTFLNEVDFSVMLTTSWQRVDGQLTSPATAGGAQVFCGIPTYPSAWFDLFYLNASGPHF